MLLKYGKFDYRKSTVEKNVLLCMLFCCPQYNKDHPTDPAI